jgi:GTP pyrophosphokinase
MGYQGIEDLQASIGYGKTAAKAIVQGLDPGKALEESPAPPESRLTTMVKKMLRRPDNAIKVTGRDDLLVYRAKCCGPIPGDEIVGYVNPGRGISVHSVNCPKVETMVLDPERRVEVKWTENGREEKYPVRLSIYTEDRKGILAAITSAISEANTNIVTVQARPVGDNYGRVDMTLEVADTKQLDSLTDLLKGLSGVREVERARRRAKEAAE